MDRTAQAREAAARMNRILDALDMRARRHQESAYEGLTYAEGRALCALGRLAPASLGALAQAIGVKASAASLTLERLVAKGMAEKRPAPTDRRALEILPTSRGTQAIAALEAWVEEDCADMLKVLEDPEVAHFISLLGRIAEGLNRPIR